MSEDRQNFSNKVPVLDLDTALANLTEDERKALVGTRVKASDGVYEFREVDTVRVGNETVKRVEAVRLSDDNSVFLGENDNVKNDYSDFGFLEEMYDDYLTAVQNFNALLRMKKAGSDIGKLYDENSTFEQYIQDALCRNKEQREVDLPKQLSAGRINQQVYQNAKTVLEMTYDTMKRFLNGEIKF